MKPAHLDTGDGLRLAIAGDDGWVDVAQASGDSAAARGCPD